MFEINETDLAIFYLLNTLEYSTTTFWSVNDVPSVTETETNMYQASKYKFKTMF